MGYFWFYVKKILVVVGYSSGRVRNRYEGGCCGGGGGRGFSFVVLGSYGFILKVNYMY